MDNFWTFKAGDLFVAFGVIVSWMIFTSQTRKLHEDNIRRLQAIETKLEFVYEWFKKNIFGGRDSA